MTDGRDARRIRPPPVSRHPGSVSGPYFGESKFPLVPPLRSTDSAESSPSLFARFITTMDESDCFLSPLMDYGFLLSHKAPARAGERASPPRSRDKICVRAWVLGHRRAWLALTTAVQPVLPSTGTTVSALPSKEFFDAHWPRPHAPLPTLRRRPHGRPRTARGETWMVSPSFQRTFTAYLVPVSLAHCPLLSPLHILNASTGELAAVPSGCNEQSCERPSTDPGTLAGAARPGGFGCSYSDAWRGVGDRGRRSCEVGTTAEGFE